MLDDILSANIFAYFMVLLRIGSVLMVLPGFGETYVAPRFRLMAALALSLVLTPLALPALPSLPGDPFTLFLLMLGEVLVGTFIGMLARFLLAALQLGGMIIAYQSGLANAFVNDPTSASQGALFGAFLSVAGILLLFTSDAHYVILSGFIDSYSVFAPGQAPPIDDFSDGLARMLSESFSLGVRISAPFLLLGFVFYLALGLLGRLMPQLQVFFVALPAQVALGLAIFMLSISGALMVFLDGFKDSLGRFMAGT